ncbi:hypothetical protein CEXT_676561 [Caerostris extrusa]|uniref:Uncharacterized protein n=1 Tax=Caerostris extrusa TaxID=172846 RepID=A0AAV4U3I4_CAEEX|nr:hypothetical protein CEXT_676561 [Caerostris extrusa]
MLFVYDGRYHQTRHLRFQTLSCRPISIPVVSSSSLLDLSQNLRVCLSLRDSSVLMPVWSCMAIIGVNLAPPENPKFPCHPNPRSSVNCLGLEDAEVNVATEASHNQKFSS